MQDNRSYKVVLMRGTTLFRYSSTTTLLFLYGQFLNLYFFFPLLHTFTTNLPNDTEKKLMHKNISDYFDVGRLQISDFIRKNDQK